MKKPENDKPASADGDSVNEETAPAPEEDAGTPSILLSEEELLGHEEAPKPDPKEQLAELEALAAKLPEKLERLSALEKLKAKYEKEVADFIIDPLAPDAEEMLRIRRSREQMIEMVGYDIGRLTDTEDPERSRMRTLISGLKDTIQEAIERDTVLLREEIRGLAKANPAVAFVFDDLEPTDVMIAALPIVYRPDRILSVAWNFATYWKDYEADRLAEELPKFLATARQAVEGKRFIALPATA